MKLRINIEDPRLFQLPTEVLASELLQEAGGIRRNAEVALWDLRKELTDEDRTGHSYLMRTIVHIVDGTEKPPVPNENGHLRKVMVGVV